MFVISHNYRAEKSVNCPKNEQVEGRSRENKNELRAGDSRRASRETNAKRGESLDVVEKDFTINLD
jgi:hypothetical protein